MNENPDAVHEGGVDYRIETRLSRIEHWRIAIEIAALIVAAAWGLYVFVYQERIKPALAPALLEPNISVTHTLTASGQEFVAVDCELKNIGATEVSLVGVAVSAYGTRFASRPSIRAPIRMPDTRDGGMSITPSTLPRRNSYGMPSISLLQAATAIVTSR
jgi:hypothetical protein